MFGCHWSWASEDEVFNLSRGLSKLCRAPIERSSNFMSGISSYYITTLARLVAISIVVVQNVFILSHDQARPHN